MNYLTESIDQGDLEIGLQLSKNLTTNRDSNATPLNANLVNGDSDADSGIVAIGPTRIGSASSTDTDPDVTLTSAYGNKSSSISSSSSSNQDSTNPTPIPISLHQDKRKPIFQRVRFDDQSPPTHLALRKSLSHLSTSMYSPKGATTINQLTSEPKMRLNSSANQNQSTVLPKETHPLAHRRLTIPSPLPLKTPLTTSLSSTPSPSSSSSTSSSSVTTISKPIDRSWSTLPRNNKIGTNNNAKSTSTLNQKNRNNFQSTLTNGTRKSFLDAKKPDLIESHSVKLSLSSSFRSSPDPGKLSKFSTLPNGLKTQKSLSLAPTTPAITNTTTKTSTGSTTCMSKSRSCSTLNNNSKEKSTSNTNESNEPKITKLCTIDPLESTDSMVCAFASVANVVSDDASSIVNDKVSVDKAVAAAVAAVNFVTNNQVNLSSPATKSVNRPSHSMTPIDNNANGHLYSNQSVEYSPQFNSNQHFQRINLSQNSKKIEFHEMEDDIKENDNLDHQYEAIFPCGKTSTSNEPESGLTASSSATVPLLPLESLVQSKVLIGNSVERKSKQLSVNSNESEPSNGQRSIESQDSNIAQHHFPQYQPHHSHSQHHHHHFHHNLEKTHANSNINDETVNPISTGIHYRSILKRSSTSSPNWPLQSIHFGGEEDGKVSKQVEDSVNGEGMKDNQRKLESADNSEKYLGEGEAVSKEDEEVERREEEGKQGKEKDEDKFVQKQDKTMPMALQINGPYLISSGSPSSPSTHLISSFSSQSMNQQNQQLKQTNVAPKMMATYLSSNGILSSINKQVDDPCEAAYLQPDQIYPLPSSKSKPTATPTSVTMLLKIKDEEQKNESQETCQVEYATISKSVTKKQDSHEANRPNHLNHSYLHHSNHPSTQHSTFPQQSPTPIHYKFNEQTRSMIEGKQMSSPGNNSIVKVTRFAMDVNDGVNQTNCAAQPVQATVQGASNKWLSKRIGGLRKALSRAFSTDKLPKDHHLSNNQSTANSSLLASSLTASANLKSSLAAASVNHISSSKSTPNLNSKLESNDSLQKNHSTEDLSIDLKSFVKTVKNRMSFRKAKGKSKSIDKDNSINQIEKQDESKTKWNNVNAKENYNQESNQLWGELIELKADGSQVIELNRPQSKPFGFFLARGTVNNVKGVFVSRMRDEQTQTILTGLLEIGDEIVAIDGLDVKSHNIAQVNQLMSIKKKIKLTVRPYINQNH